MRDPLTRPLSLSLIGWHLAAVAAWSFVHPFVSSDGPGRFSPGTLYFLGFFDAWLWGSCAIGLLRGREWGRFLFAGVWVLAIAIAAVKLDAESWMRVGLVSFLTYLLFRPAVTEYFVNLATLRDPDLTAWPPSRSDR